MTQKKPIDKLFLIATTLLTSIGFIIFLSASLGLINGSDTSFFSISMKQALSLIIGIIFFYIFSRINYRYLRRFSFFIFLFTIFINLLLFVPSIAMSHGGAARWIDLGFISFQPSELLKISFIIYLAAWIAYAKDKIQTISHGLLPYIVLLIISSILLFFQRDTDTLAVIAFTGILMLVIGGAKYKHILIAVLCLASFIALVIFTRPYALERVKTYFNRGSDSQGSGYQINQSLIAIGSGQYFGRGFGQSIQKFGYLPQPTDDSIFAVAGEEFGFFGTTIIILLYIFFGFSVFRLGLKIHDIFGTSLVMGIAVLILTESFLNISAMIGVTPLSGLPLLFMSHGGTALIVTLMSAGIIASVSRHEIKQVS